MTSFLYVYFSYYYYILLVIILKFLNYCNKYILYIYIYSYRICYALSDRVFENRVLRRILGPKRDMVTGGCRKLHNKENHNLYSSPSTIRRIKTKTMRWAGHVARIGAEKNICKILVGKSEGKRPLGRP
jgi:hypothetical protein